MDGMTINHIMSIDHGSYHHIHNIMMFFRKYISGANYRACIYPCVVLERCLN